jgi:regulator of replication initiation timing
MDDNSLPNKLGNLENKIGLLLDSHQNLKDKSETLSLENKGLQSQIEELTTQLNDFQNQDKITKIVSSNTVEKEEATELKYKLNEYIKEIDRCIAHLS